MRCDVTSAYSLKCTVFARLFRLWTWNEATGNAVWGGGGGGGGVRQNVVINLDLSECLGMISTLQRIHSDS